MCLVATVLNSTLSAEKWFSFTKKNYENNVKALEAK